MNNDIYFFNNLKKSLITFLIIPFILIGCIYISYGEIFETFISQNINHLRFYQLHTQLSIFQNEPSITSSIPLPKVTASIGYYSVIFIYVLFFSWLVLFAISSYLKLSHGFGSKFIIIIELVMILTIYFISIRPGLDLWLSMFASLTLLVIIVILLLYLVYEIKTLR